MQFYLIFVLNCITEIDENYASFCLVNMLTVPNFLDFTINAVLHPTFIQKLCHTLSSIPLHLYRLFETQCKCVNIAKTVGDTSNWKLLLMTNRKLHMRFRLTPLYKFDFFREFREIYISQIWEATPDKRVKIDPYCQRRYCSPLNVLFSGVSLYRMRWYRKAFLH